MMVERSLMPLRLPVHLKPWASIASIGRKIGARRAAPALLTGWRCINGPTG